MGFEVGDDLILKTKIFKLLLNI